MLSPNDLRTFADEYLLLLYNILYIIELLLCVLNLLIDSSSSQRNWCKSTGFSKVIFKLHMLELNDKVLRF